MLDHMQEDHDIDELEDDSDVEMASPLSSSSNRIQATSLAPTPVSPTVRVNPVRRRNYTNEQKAKLLAWYENTSKFVTKEQAFQLGLEVDLSPKQVTNWMRRRRQTARPKATTQPVASPSRAHFTPNPIVDPITPESSDTENNAAAEKFPYLDKHVRHRLIYYFRSSKVPMTTPRIESLQNDLGVGKGTINDIYEWRQKRDLERRQHRLQLTSRSYSFDGGVPTLPPISMPLSPPNSLSSPTITRLLGKSPPLVKEEMNSAVSVGLLTPQPSVERSPPPSGYQATPPEHQGGLTNNELIMLLVQLKASKTSREDSTGLGSLFQF